MTANRYDPPKTAEEEIASDLEFEEMLEMSEEERDFDRITKGVIGPCPGSNALPLVRMLSKDRRTVIYGEEMEALHRAGLLSVTPTDQRAVVPKSDEYGGIDLDHIWSVSDLGRAVLSPAGQGGRDE